jgi:Xaa-Pro dipeptidase
MLEETRQRADEFTRRLDEAKHRAAVITDVSSIAYLAGAWGYLGLEFGRPTVLVLAPGHEPTLITPLMEAEMVRAMTWIDNVVGWTDSGTPSWHEVLATALGGDGGVVGVEMATIPGLIADSLREANPNVRLTDVSAILSEMRVIKSEKEISVMRQAGAVGKAMMTAAHQTLAAGVPEYEIALAVLTAGTRAAAELLRDDGWERFVSPMIHNLQIMQSGRDTSMVHRRANTRRLQPGDPVYFCFCNLLEFKHYRLGFDRMFFVAEPTPGAVRLQSTAIAAQQAALAEIREGAVAENVARAANEVYEGAGLSAGYRTGRGIGISYLEPPELKEGDKTVLQAGMTCAVDGGVSVDGESAGRIGDSIVVTRTGFEYLTDYPRDGLVV